MCLGQRAIFRSWFTLSTMKVLRNLIEDIMFNSCAFMCFFLSLWPDILWLVEAAFLSPSLFSSGIIFAFMILLISPFYQDINYSNLRDSLFLSMTSS